MSKSLLLVSNTTANAVSAGSTIPLGSIVRRCGYGITLSDSEIIITQPGYYSVDVGTTFTGTAGNVVIDVQHSGKTIAGATTSDTIGTANTEYHSAAIPTATRVYCNALSTISVKVDSTSTSTPTIRSITVRVERE